MLSPYSVPVVVLDVWDTTGGAPQETSATKLVRLNSLCFVCGNKWRKQIRDIN